MYSVVTILLLVAAASAGLLPHQPTNVYLPPSNIANSFTSSAFSRNSYPSQQIAIVRQVNENNGDGTFVYSFETEDGQSAEARGQIQDDGSEGSQITQGSYSFTAPDGIRYTVTYSAGGNGFEAQGAHLPVPPPVPEAILKALADNAAEEARGVYDDGSYKGEGAPSQRGNIGITQAFQKSQQVAYQQNQQSGYQYQKNQQVAYQQNQQSGYQYQQNQQGGYQLPVSGRQLHF